MYSVGIDRATKELLIDYFGSNIEIKDLESRSGPHNMFIVLL